MTNENIVIAIFVGALLASALGVYLFFVRMAYHRGTARGAIRLIVGNALILLVALSLVLVGGEIYFRFIYDGTDAFGLAKVNQAWLRRHYQLNDQGLRDSINDYPPAPPPGVRRITFIGDSFTEGHGIANVDDRFTNLIRAKYPQWQVHVFARGGLDTHAALTMLGTMAKRGYQFDTLVLVYNLNDIADLMPQWQDVSDRIWRHDKPGFIIQHSYFLNFVFYRVKAINDPDMSNYFQFLRGAYDAESPYWKRQAQLLSVFKEAMDVQGGRLLVVTFPFLHQLGEQYAFADAHARLEERWASLNVPHLDLLDTFAGQSPSEMTVNRFDAHPNEQAHAIAADAIGRFLEQHMEESNELR